MTLSKIALIEPPALIIAICHDVNQKFFKKSLDKEETLRIFVARS